MVERKCGYIMLNKNKQEKRNTSPEHNRSKIKTQDEANPHTFYSSFSPSSAPQQR